MRLGIVSDTHDNVGAVERSVGIFEEADVEVIVHCGDFIAPPVVPFFRGFEVHGVLGNNDGEIDGLEAAFRDLGMGSELHGRFADLALGETRLAALHGENKDAVYAWAESGNYDYVCYGHHHETEHREVGDAVVVNPGAHFPTVPEEHRRVAIIDTDTDEVHFRSV